MSTTDGGDGCGVVTDGGDRCGVVTNGGDGCDVVTDAVIATKQLPVTALGL